MLAHLGLEELLQQIQSQIPRRPFVPSVTEVASACLCPRALLLKVIYGATGKYSSGLAIGSITHLALSTRCLCDWPRHRQDNSDCGGACSPAVPYLSHVVRVISLLHSRRASPVSVQALL